VADQSLTKELVVRLLHEAAGLKRTNAELREEVARLKGLKGRPDIKPSGMEKATEQAKPGSQERRRRRGKVQSRVNVEDRVIAREIGVGRTTVQDYLTRATAAGLGWPLPPDLTDEAGTVPVPCTQQQAGYPPPS
jgi:hypothetical protein